MAFYPGSIRTHIKEKGISAVSYWPLEGENDIRRAVPAGDGGEWSLYLDHERGAMFIWPTAKRVPASFNPNLIARHHDKAELLKSFQSYCTSEHGRWDDHPYEYQDNAHFFNWGTGTLAGVGIAMLVIEASLGGNIGRGWDIGKFWEAKGERGMDPEYWAARDEAEAKMAAAELEEDETEDGDIESTD